jgi:hypothetical protein
MRFYCDEDDGILTASPGVREALQKAVFRFANTRAVEIQFLQNGVVISRPPGSTGKFALKKAGAYSQDPLVEATSWTKIENGGLPYYRFNPDFSGESLAALLASSTSGYVDLMMEIEWTDGESVGSTVPEGNTEVMARVWNEINQTGSTSPDPGPDPYPTSDKLILHYDGVTGWTGADSLEEIPSEGIPTGRLIAWNINGRTRHAKLITSSATTQTASNPVYVRPLDYDTRVWISHEEPDPDTAVVHCDPDITSGVLFTAMVTADLADFYPFQFLGQGLYVLRPGTAATMAPWIYQPDDFDAEDNARVWVKELDGVEVDASLASLMGGDAGDLDKVPTAFMSEGQIVEVSGAATSPRYRLEEKEFTTVSILSVSSNSIFTGGTLPAVDDVVECFTSGTLPGNISLGEFLYVVSVNDGANSFQVSETHRGTVKSITSAGTGSHTFVIHEDPFWVRPLDYDVSGMAWRLIGPDTTFTFTAVETKTTLLDGRHFAAFSPVAMLPKRIQFDLASNGSEDVTIGLEAALADLISGGNITFGGRSSSTDLEEAVVSGIIFPGDELVAEVSGGAAAKGLLIHLTGLVAPLLGPSIGGQFGAYQSSDLLAIAGADATVTAGSTVVLDASGSTANTSPVSYAWTQTGGPSVSLLNPTSAQPSFTAPQVSIDTDLTFQLAVSNSETLDQDTDSVTITVENLGLVAEAGPAQTVSTGAAVTLTSAGSTAITPGLVSYEWEQIWGPAVTLSSANVASPTFTAPDDARAYAFRLHVINTGSGAAVTDDVVIEVVDVALGGAYATVSAIQCVDRNDARLVFGCADGSVYTSDDGLEFFRLVTGIGVSISDISTRPDGVAVAVTADGIWRTRNGLTWEETLDQYSGVDWGAIADSGTMFVAVSNTGKYARSIDGVTWTEATLVSGVNFGGVASDGASKFLAVGTTGTIAYSSNNGVTWASVDLGSQTFTGAAYSPTLDRWVVTGGSYLGSFADSVFGSGISGGITNHYSGGTFYDVDWDPINECFLAVGFNCARVSYDGTTWTDVYATIGSPGASRRVANFGGKFALATSTNFIVLTQQLPA